MIEIPRQAAPPTEAGQYLSVIAGTPLPIVLAWTQDYGWLRGNQKVARVSNWIGPITVERRKHAPESQD